MRGNEGQYHYKFLSFPLGKLLNDDGETAIVRGYYTSDAMDEAGDIITKEATERAIQKYRQWGNIRYMHMPRPVGKVLRIGSLDGLEWNEVEFKVIDPQAAFEVRNGLLTALSVGLIASLDDIEMLPEGGWQFNDYLLAEISLVDHPCNYDAALTSIKGMIAGLQMPRLAQPAQEGEKIVEEPLEEIKTVIPYRDTGKADEDTPWSKPDLSDFTDQSFDEMGDAEKRRIAAHYTFAVNYPPKTFGDLKLPHHEAAKDGVGPANWNGVRSAMARARQSNTDVDDREGIEAHLIKHYKDFGKEPPEKGMEGDLDPELELDEDDILVLVEDIDPEMPDEVTEPIQELNKVVEPTLEVEEVAEPVLEVEEIVQPIEEITQQPTELEAIKADLASLKAELTNVVEIAKALAEAVRAQDEQPSGEDLQAEVADLKEKITTLEAEIQRLQAENDLLRLPQGRRGGLPETELPELPDETEGEPEEQKPLGLKAAVRKFIESSQ